MVCNDLSTFYCISFLRFYNVISVGLNILMYMIIYDYHWSQCSLEVFCVTVISGEHQVCFHAISLPSGQARQVD